MIIDEGTKYVDLQIHFQKYQSASELGMRSRCLLGHLLITFAYPSQLTQGVDQSCTEAKYRCAVQIFFVVKLESVISRSSYSG